MAATLIEKIIAAHCESDFVVPGEIVDLRLDARVARDFGGANVVKNLRAAELSIADPGRTFFTFDCNPGGSDQDYAANQHLCRLFARERGIAVHDINRGIGTHIAIEAGLAWPGSTFVSTDSHANIMGAIGAFGQGMGDADIAGAFAHGSVWFEVPPTVKVIFEGQPAKGCAAKDLTLAACGQLGAKGLLGCAAEVYGDVIDGLGLAGRVTLSSMATEMGAITVLIPPSEEVLAFCGQRMSEDFEALYADEGASYVREVVVNVEGLTPRVSRPGHPDDVHAVEELGGPWIDSAFIGSCTNGRLADLRVAAEVLVGRKVKEGVVLKIVPATDEVWCAALEEGLFEVFKAAGALVSNAGCAGCAAGQVGQNGPGEVTISSGNRNFPGKQGRGDVYLASPATIAASAVAGAIVTAEQLVAGTVPQRRVAPSLPALVVSGANGGEAQKRVSAKGRPRVLRGRAWVVDVDSVDTDMIYHNRYLAETDPAKMGRHAFGNLPGWEDFSGKVQAGDVLVVGANFGAGSSRQQAVTCFLSLGVSAIVGRSFGAIYERNAINEGMPALRCDFPLGAIANGDTLEIDLESGQVENLTRGTRLDARPLSPVQLRIYQRGGLLARV
ncbi:MAG: 3-isopropylmalate dehydratase large subunit [Deltaproteobacteria bacterium]|nr:3-isopropylmalate dehydratase large subunit [Deltaproteobacteria bacterium]